MKRDPELNACVRDAWHIREEVVRRLLHNATQRLQLELILIKLDRDFAGHTFVDDEHLDDDEPQHQEEQ